MARTHEVLSIEETCRTELPSIAFTTTAFSATLAVASAAVASAAVASTTAFVSAAASSARISAASSVAPAIDLADACCGAQRQINDDFDDDASTVADSEPDMDRKEMSKICWADLMDSDDEEFLVEADLQVELHRQHEGKAKPECSEKKFARASWADLADSDTDGEEFVPRSMPQASCSLKAGGAPDPELVKVPAAEEIKPEIKHRDTQRKRIKSNNQPIADSHEHPSPNAAQSQSQRNDFSTNICCGQREEPTRIVKGTGKGVRGTTKGKGKGKGASTKGAKGVGKGLNAKLQCQFTVGIEDDSKFRVVKRIIGNGGENMKRIAELSGAKLRLRGRGSKFLEGPEQQESTDGLMLCLSSQDKIGYEHAKDLVSELLKNIYHNYDVFCQKPGKIPSAKSLGVQLHEGYREGSR